MNIEEEILELKSRIKRLEELIGAGQPVKKPNPYISKPAVQPAQTAEKQIDWEYEIGRVWMPRIFVIVLLLGVVWGFIAAMNAGLINEQVRVAIGYIASIALFFTGRSQFNHQRNALGQALLAGGTGIGILSTFAGHMLYGFIPWYLAGLLDLVYVAATVYFSKMYRSEALAVLSVVAGLLIPFLIKTDHPSMLYFVSFETLVSLIFMLYGIYSGFVYLPICSLASLHVSFLSVFWFSGMSGNKLFVFGAAIQYLLLIGFLYFYKSNKNEYPFVFPRQVVALLFSAFLILWAGFNLSQLSFHTLLLIMIALYAGLSWIKFRDKDSFVLASVSAMFLLFVYITDAFDSQASPVFLLIESTLGIFLGFYFKSKFQFVFGSVIYCIGAFMIIFFEASTLGLFHPINGGSQWANWVAFAVTAWAIYYFKNTLPPTEPFQFAFYKVYKWIYPSVTILFLTNLVLTPFQSYGPQTHHAVITLTWAICAFISMTVGVMNHSAAARRFGIILLLITLCKLLLVDLVYVSIVIRAILFIGAGALGVFSSRLFYKK